MEKSSQNRQIAQLFRVLSVETRVAIVRLLAGRGPLCVGALAEELQVSSGAVSQHLRVMRDNGLVQDERRGYFIHYRLAPDVRDRLSQAEELLFEGSDDQRPRGAACHGKSNGSCG